MLCPCRGGLPPESTDSLDGIRPAPVDSKASIRPGLNRAFRSLARWGPPVAVLALVPKCPACVAGYVLLLTGVGISMPAAAAVRWALIAASVAAIAYLVIRTVRRAIVPGNEPAKDAATASSACG